ncbi:hypothetical protein GCM10010527_23370 [Streptomyces drozdowiczii]
MGARVLSPCRGGVRVAAGTYERHRPPPMGPVATPGPPLCAPTPLRGGDRRRGRGGGPRRPRRGARPGPRTMYAHTMHGYAGVCTGAV